MSDILDTILARKAEEVAARRAQVPLETLIARVEQAPPVRGFADALRASITAGNPAVI
ncbi:indole-3-glycerol-phosphate synthase TrpC, partial [Mycobacterium tuberculosis]